MDRSLTVPDLICEAPSCSPLSVKAANSLERFLLALSLANLCYLFVWSEVLRISSEKAIRYFLTQPPDPAFFWAVVIDVVILCAAIFLLLSLQKLKNQALQIFSKLSLTLIPLFALYQLWLSVNASFYGSLSKRGLIMLRLAMIVLLTVFLLRTRRRALPYLRKAALILAPLFFVFLVQGLWTYYGPASRRLGPGHAAGLLPAFRSGARVVWIIFDELDGRLLFENRPARIHTPHFNALRDHSLFADHVKSPARDTISAIPSLLLSKRIPQDYDVDLDIRPLRRLFTVHQPSLATQHLPPCACLRRQHCCQRLVSPLLPHLSQRFERLCFCRGRGNLGSHLAGAIAGSPTVCQGGIPCRLASQTAPLKPALSLDQPHAGASCLSAASFDPQARIRPAKR